MIKIQADWVKYNANTRNKNVGDCVKRALSYAYGVDYDEISRQLNRMKGETSSDLFNENKNWRRFLYKNKGFMLPDKDYKGITEAEFCEKYPHGVYVCLTGKKVDKSSHLVCIFNGDIIDSWNSSNYVVIEAYEIKDTTLDIVEVSWEDIEDPLCTFIDDYIASVNKKWRELFDLSRDPKIYTIDDSTKKMVFIETTKGLPKSSKYLSYTEYDKYIMIKLNPRMSTEKNLESLKTQLKGRVYNFVYPFEKDIKDSIAIADMETNWQFNDTTSNKKKIAHAA